MTTLANDPKHDIEATNVVVTAHHLTVDLSDGRTISVPLSWYPRLMHGTAAERSNVEISPMGLHWPDLDEDLSIDGIITGRRSAESAKSLQRWLEFRARGEQVPVRTAPLPDELAKELASMGIDPNER
jgi:hypothetical protein